MEVDPQSNGDEIAVNGDPNSRQQQQHEKMESDSNDLNSLVLDPNVMAPSSVSTPAVTVSLHPLVIMNVSEHWTRIKAQEGTPQQVIGALIGKQKGRSLEIMNSFELLYDKIEGDYVIDRDYYAIKESQFKQVFPELDFLGWYTTGDAPNSSDMKIHKQICEINESPVFLKMNPMVCFYNYYVILVILIM